MTLTASSALVIDNDAITLVDPGSIGGLASVIERVEHVGVPWQSVNQVFYTHLHFDHYETSDFSDNIKQVFMPRKEVSFIFSLMEFRDDEERYRAFLLESHEKIARVFLRQFIYYREDVRYSTAALGESERIVHYDEKIQVSENSWSVPLPGHCVGLHGLAIEMEGGRGIIASDAVLSEADWRADDIEHHMILFDRDAWWKSRKKLMEFDWVLPGHGDAFNPKFNSEPLSS